MADIDKGMGCRPVLRPLWTGVGAHTVMRLPASVIAALTVR